MFDEIDFGLPHLHTTMFSLKSLLNYMQYKLAFTHNIDIYAFKTNPSHCFVRGK